MATSILARETASILSENPYHPDTLVKHFDVPIVPRIPLHIGQRVKILSLTACEGPTDEELAPTRYRVQDSGVEGAVVRIKSTSTAVTEFIVQNENDSSPVIFACVAIQHIQGQTVWMGLWDRLLRVVVRPPPPERCIPLELDAIVIRNPQTTRQWSRTDGRWTPGAREQADEPEGGRGSTGGE